MRSNDSLYFKIILPNEDALYYKNFYISIIPSPLYGQIHEVNKQEFSILNKMMENVNFSFIIQNIAPKCGYGTKSYQRVYFNVFENYKANNKKSNFFTITLKLKA